MPLNTSAEIVITYRGSSSERLPTCRVCMCPAECATATPCGHLYCWDCIATWCSGKASCPLCRTSVLPQELLPLCHYEVSPAGEIRDAVVSSDKRYFNAG